MAAKTISARFQAEADADLLRGLKASSVPMTELSRPSTPTTHDVPRWSAPQPEVSRPSTPKPEFLRPTTPTTPTTPDVPRFAADPEPGVPRSFTPPTPDPPCAPPAGLTSPDSSRKRARDEFEETVHREVRRRFEILRVREREMLRRVRIQDLKTMKEALKAARAKDAAMLRRALARAVHEGLRREIRALHASFSGAIEIRAQALAAYTEPSDVIEIDE